MNRYENPESGSAIESLVWAFRAIQVLIVIFLLLSGGYFVIKVKSPVVESGLEVQGDGNAQFVVEARLAHIGFVSIGAAKVLGGGRHEPPRVASASVGFPAPVVAASYAPAAATPVL